LTNALPPRPPNSGSRRSALLELERLTAERERRRSRNRLKNLYPDDGPLRRELLSQTPEFLCGRTAAPGALHDGGKPRRQDLGRRRLRDRAAPDRALSRLVARAALRRPIEAWAAGDTSETTRDIVQAALMGPLGELGTGLIPARCIIGEPTSGPAFRARWTPRHPARHGRAPRSSASRATTRAARSSRAPRSHVIWLDEEPPEDVYDECLMRLMTTNGLMLCTFTPLEGLTDIALRFLPQLKARRMTRFCVQATWDDVPHLTAQQKIRSCGTPSRSISATPAPRAFRFSARAACSSIAEDKITCEPFDVPRIVRAHHRRRLRHRSSVRRSALRLGSRQRYLVRDRQLPREAMQRRRSMPRRSGHGAPGCRSPGRMTG
jgi:phage terminase large subunit-like protein